VLAEGVETQDQVAFLSEHALADGASACEVQGFLYSHPLPAAECAALLGARRQLN
jgi:EAL domain-containing protein (putative c-di-GMP-specific phosphodiesterase class I)